MPKSGDPCQHQACDIQRCLQAHNYKEEYCRSVFEAMEKCCAVWQKESICCSGFVRPKFMQEEDEEKERKKQQQAK